MADSPAVPSSAPPAAPSLSLLQRTVAVFTRPAEAWGGLESRVQWWFPMLVLLVFMGIGVLAIHERAVVPTMMDTFDEQVANGQMSAEAATGAERFMTSPIGMTFVVVQQSIVMAAVSFLSALAISFSVGFLMGGKLRYRLALEVATWSFLVTLPGQLLFFVLAWSRETMQGVHIGLGAFVPEPETPSRLLRGLAVFLDFLGPFSIWGLVVAIFGAAALSGLPRRSVAWTLSAVHLVLWLFLAGLAVLFTPGA